MSAFILHLNTTYINRKGEKIRIKYKIAEGSALYAKGYRFHDADFRPYTETGKAGVNTAVSMYDLLSIAESRTKPSNPQVRPLPAGVVRFSTEVLDTITIPLADLTQIKKVVIDVPQDGKAVELEVTVDGKATSVSLFLSSTGLSLGLSS